MQNGGVRACDDAPVPTAAAVHNDRRDWDRECVLLRWDALERLLAFNSWYGARAEP